MSTHASIYITEMTIRFIFPILRGVRS
jgi:hypothetical protein